MITPRRAGNQPPLGYATQKGWRVELMSLSEGNVGGYKEVIATITGEKVYSNLKYESGVHRVQRVPKTEASGRIHTSTVTVAVIPEAEETEVKINPTDLRVDVMRSSGAGGQSVNKTESAVRLTHLPSGIVVYCQEGKSQHANRDRAMKILFSRLKQLEEDKRKLEANAWEKVFGAFANSEGFEEAVRLVREYHESFTSEI